LTDTSTFGRQAAKSRDTREKILRAAISLIREGGMAGATSARIAERAGMTWGAAQYHFGSKEQILAAVIQVSHEKYLASLSDMTAGRRALRARVSEFVERSWAHYQDEIFLAAVEIILAWRDLDPAVRRQEAFERPGPDHLAMMVRIFGDSGASPADLMEALLYVHALLTGLSIQVMLQGDLDRLDRHLARCKKVMESMIAAAAPPQA
jgi:AcrR family transcriptional regulator